jgi:3-dehydroquinate synthetase
VIKYGCIWDPLLFDWLELNIDNLTRRDPKALAYAIGRSCEIKAQVVAQDERESNVRALLNFGHTFGHAIESATQYASYLHGEAVGLGMLMAASLSRRLGWLDATEHARIRDLLMRAGLPTEAPRMGVSRALELMQMDKKVLSGTVRLVLLERLGRAVVTGAYEQDMLDATLAEYCA